MIKTLRFKLTFYNTGTNDHAGHNSNYIIFRQVDMDTFPGADRFNDVYKLFYPYHIGDRWFAQITVTIEEPGTLKPDGFQNYEWMVDSIIKRGKIVKQ